MQIKYTSLNTIPDDELITAGIDLMDKDAIIEYFFENGGPDTYEDCGLDIEVTPD